MTLFYKIYKFSQDYKYHLMLNHFLQSTAAATDLKRAQKECFTLLSRPSELEHSEPFVGRTIFFPKIFQVFFQIFRDNFFSKDFSGFFFQIFGGNFFIFSGVIFFSFFKRHSISFVLPHSFSRNLSITLSCSLCFSSFAGLEHNSCLFDTEKLVSLLYFAFL